MDSLFFAPKHPGGTPRALTQGLIYRLHTKRRPATAAARGVEMLPHRVKRKSQRRPLGQGFSSERHRP